MVGQERRSNEVKEMLLNNFIGFLGELGLSAGSPGSSEGALLLLEQISITILGHSIPTCLHPHKSLCLSKVLHI